MSLSRHELTKCRRKIATKNKVQTHVSQKPDSAQHYDGRWDGIRATYFQRTGLLPREVAEPFVLSLSKRFGLFGPSLRVISTMLKNPSSLKWVFSSFRCVRLQRNLAKNAFLAFPCSKKASSNLAHPSGGYSIAESPRGHPRGDPGKVTPIG